MGATTNSNVLGINWFHRGSLWVGALGLLVALCVLFFPLSINHLQAGDATNIFQLRAAKAYQATKEAYVAAPKNDEAAWRYGRACFDMGEFAKDDDERERYALEGIAVCRTLVARTPKHALGHYYLGMNLGQLARTKTLGALSIVREMEKVFKLAADLDDKVHYSGPDRCLGVLYREAPGWPTSIGSKTKARQHLQRAVDLSPEYPDNRLELMEAFMQWKETKSLQSAAKEYEKILPKAHELFTGEDWEESWQNWDKRWEVIQNKLRK